MQTESEVCEMEMQQLEGLKDQFDPQDMIEKMIEIIPAEHHKFRTVHPKETEEQLKKTENDDKL